MMNRNDRLFGYLYSPLSTEDEYDEFGQNSLRRSDSYSSYRQRIIDSDFALHDTKGMRVTSGSAILEKDAQNLVGISIGGGAPNCPCVYVVQIFDNTPASRSGVLASGDEITGVNGESVKGRTKVEVAKLIQSYKDKVTIFYNKLHADPTQGKSLDIVLKKAKHLIVENMRSTTADALGLSRAILVNDNLVKKLDYLQQTAILFNELMVYMRRVLRVTLELSGIHRAFGEVFADVGVKEPQPRASEAFTQFGECHRAMEKYAMESMKKLKPIVTDLKTFLSKVIPDTRLTVRKYLDTKFEYLSYCLKVKEMDDEEYSYAALREPLYRVDTGNYEYRLILRCRQEARANFAKLRNDVLVKLELLDNKHVQDVVKHLHEFVTHLSIYHTECYETLRKTQIFPIELELKLSQFTSATEEALSENLELNDDEDDDGDRNTEILDMNKFFQPYRDDPEEENLSGSSPFPFSSGSALLDDDDDDELISTSDAQQKTNFDFGIPTDQSLSHNLLD